MLTRERMDRMIDARDEGEALKVLSECGYGGTEGVSGQSLEGLLTQARAETFGEIRGAVPDPRVAEVFQMKYDYHNAKTLVKGEAVGIDARRLLSQGGRYDPELLADEYQKENLSGVSPAFQRAVREAREFALNMKRLIGAGVDIVGGCCGTTPEYIRELKGIL